MEFVYIGEAKNMSVYGYDFSNGQSQKITDDFVMKKLANNSDFKRVDIVQHDDSDNDFLMMTPPQTKNKK